jgi:hypothetical protein
MTTMPITIELETIAQLAFLAKLKKKPETEVLKNLVEAEFIQECNKMSKSNTTVLQTPLQTGHVRPGKRGQSIRYTGSDSRLKNGGIYKSFAEVLRVVRPDLEGLLYNAKKHSGDKAENILKHYEPESYRNLSRLQK